MRFVWIAFLTVGLGAGCKSRAFNASNVSTNDAPPSLPTCAKPGTTADKIAFEIDPMHSPQQWKEIKDTLAERFLRSNGWNFCVPEYNETFSYYLAILDEKIAGAEKGVDPDPIGKRFPSEGEGKESLAARLESRRRVATNSRFDVARMKEMRQLAIQKADGTYKGFWEATTHLLFAMDGCRDESGYDNFEANLSVYLTDHSTPEPKGLPFYTDHDSRVLGPIFLIPMKVASLPFETFVNLAPFPIAPVGFSSITEVPDNITSSPITYANHDLTHTRMKIRWSAQHYAKHVKLGVTQPSMENFEQVLTGWRAKETDALEYLEAMRRGPATGDMRTYGEAFKVAHDQIAKAIFYSSHETYGMPIIWEELKGRYRAGMTKATEQKCSPQAPVADFDQHVLELSRRVKPSTWNSFWHKLAREKSALEVDAYDAGREIWACFSYRVSSEFAAKP